MHNGDLGSILKKSIDASRIKTETLMRSLVYIGSTLCGAGLFSRTNFKRQRCLKTPICKSISSRLH